MKKILLSIILIIAVVFSGLTVTDTDYLLKAFRVTYLRGKTDVTIDDYHIQSTKTIKKGTPQKWELHKDYNKEPIAEDVLKMHKDYKSIAFLVIKDGQLLTEKYFNEGSESHLSGVWSISKTYTSLLILKAIEDGLIDDIDDPVSKYIPELNFNQKNELTLRHVASMSAGLFWDESAHEPLALITKLNFYDDLEKFTVEDLNAVGEPGEIQHYNSGSTQILGIVLKRVLGDKSITDYISEKFWQPLGYEYDGLYIVDSEKHGNEKAFGGIVTTARDVSKLGQLLLNNGVWKGKQLINEKDMQLFHHLPYNNKTYTFGLWSGVYEGERFIFQSGFRGQYCITFPKHNLVITRLGHETSPKDDIGDIKADVYIYLKEAIRIAEKSNDELMTEEI